MMHDAPTSGALQERLERALARCEIEALNAEFAWLIDHDLSHRVPDLFTPDGSYGRPDGQRSSGREALRRVYAARASRGPRVARHIFTNLRLEFGDDPDTVRGWCMLLLYADDGHAPLPAEANLVADYEDIYQRDATGQWRYASRTISTQFRHREGKPTVLPLGQA